MPSRRDASDKKILALLPCSPRVMERGLVVFGVLFLLLPLALVAGIVLVPGAAYALTLTLIAFVALGFGLALAFVDVE